MPTYLVTGGAGFIGSHVVRFFLERGERVRVLDDFSTGKRENLDEVEGKIDLVQGSLSSPGDVEAAVDGVDFILHQAAIPSVPRSVEFRAELPKTESGKVARRKISETGA